jgi:DNA-binding CsgD family transcriptional regulator
MSGALVKALEIAERFDAAATPAQAAASFYAAIRPFGVVGFGMRVYLGAKGSDSQRIIPGVTFQALPPKWVGSASATYVTKLDPLPAAARRLYKPAFLWSEASPHGDPAWRDYWDAYSEHATADGMAVHVMNPNGLVSRVSFGLQDPKIETRDRLALEMASFALVSRMAAALPSQTQAGLALSPRERDCLSFAAKGLTDAQIGAKLGITQSTAHFYVEQAKRKLGVRTRAQAVAQLIATGVL